jgi:hypothetical protein
MPEAIVFFPGGGLTMRCRVEAHYSLHSVNESKTFGKVP